MARALYRTRALWWYLEQQKQQTPPVDPPLPALYFISESNITLNTEDNLLLIPE